MQETHKRAGRILDEDLMFLNGTSELKEIRFEALVDGMNNSTLDHAKWERKQESLSVWVSGQDRAFVATSACTYGVVLVVQTRRRDKVAKPVLISSCHVTRRSNGTLEANC
jgi:hypothetical protein